MIGLFGKTRPSRPSGPQMRPAFGGSGDQGVGIMVRNSHRRAEDRETGAAGDLLSERAVKADASTMSRFFRKIGVTFKKDARRERAGPSGREAPSGALANLSGLDRPQAPGLHRRDVGKDQHDPPLRVGAEGAAADRQSSSRPLENRDLPRRPGNDRIDAPRLFDGPINGERFLAYVEAIPRSDPQAGRRRHPRQPRLSQAKGRAQSHPERRGASG